MEFNYIDLIIFLILFYFLSEAWRHGIWVILADFVSFFASLLISFRAYKFVADILLTRFSISLPIANALGFLLTAIVVESILGIFLGILIKKVPQRLWKNKLNRFVALFPALGEGLIIVAFVTTLIMGLPVATFLKEDVSNSKLGSLILTQSTGIEQRMNEVFGEAIEDSLTYLIIKPESSETIPLTVNKYELQITPEDETAILNLVNEERVKNGLKALTQREDLREVARLHARDMWERKYFSHFSPDGNDVGDRLNTAGIKYFVAGENLAMAPTVVTAHAGLMNSEGHRKNILESNFNNIGIGVVDNGIYGKMFVQVFTN